MLDDSEAVRHMHLSKERVKEVDEGGGVGGGCRGHNSLPRLSRASWFKRDCSCSSSRPSGERGVQERGNQRGKRLEVPVQLSSQTLGKTNMQIQVVQGHAGKYMA